MTVIDTKWINEKHSIGWIDVHNTVVRAGADFECGCGNDIRILARKARFKADKYEFTIKHRNRSQKVIAANPTETQIFDKMLKVSTYAACRFPRNTARRRVR